MGVATDTQTESMPEGRMGTLLQGSVQNEKADSLLKNYKNFKTSVEF